MLLIGNYAVTTTPWIFCPSGSWGKSAGWFCLLALTAITSGSVTALQSIPVWILNNTLHLAAFLLHITQVLYTIGKSIPLGCLYITSFANLSGKPSVPADPFGRRPCEQQDGCPQCRWKHLPLEDPQCQWGNHLVKLIWQWNEQKYPTDLDPDAD